MDFNSNSNDENKNEKKKEFGILVPYIYIKKALKRIWNFLLKGLSYGFKCKSMIYNKTLVIFYIGIPILLEARNNQFVLWMKRNGGFKKEFIIQNFSKDDDEIL